MIIAALILFIVFFILGSLHIYWLLGGTWGYSAVIPEVLKPKAESVSKKLFWNISTLVVALAMFALAFLSLINGDIIATSLPQSLLKYSSMFVALIFLLRAIGDFKHVGFFKKSDGSYFAQQDSKYFSPLCLFISILMSYLTIQYF